MKCQKTANEHERKLERLLEDIIQFPTRLTSRPEAERQLIADQLITNKAELDVAEGSRDNLQTKAMPELRRKLNTALEGRQGLRAEARAYRTAAFNLLSALVNAEVADSKTELPDCASRPGNPDRGYANLAATYIGCQNDVEGVLAKATDPKACSEIDHCASPSSPHRSSALGAEIKQKLKDQVKPLKRLQVVSRSKKISVDRMEKELEMKQNRLARLQTTIGTLKTQRGQIESRNEQFRRDMEELAGLRSEFAKATAAAAHYQSSISELEDRIDQHEKKSNQAFRQAIEHVDGVLPIPFDLILLVNPAAPALRAMNLRDSLEALGDLRQRQWGNKAKPLLVAISSKKDWATRTLFPLGQTVGQLAKLKLPQGE